MKKRTHLLLLFLVIASPIFGGCDQSGSGCDTATEDLGAIEAVYAATGEYTTTTTNITGFSIYHPQNMTGNHPIITWGNGTGAPTMTYTPLLNHLASWGFVVIASNGVMTGTGVEMIEGIDYLIEQNSNPDSPFYNKLDTAHIGATGHSQGGEGAINTASDERVTCSAPLAPSAAKADEAKSPMLLFGGDTDGFVPIAMIRRTNYSIVRVPTIFAIHKDMGHLNFLGNGGGARGYLTAWFMYQLQGDQDAALAFTIDNGEIFNNAKFTVETKNY